MHAAGGTQQLHDMCLGPALLPAGSMLSCGCQRAHGLDLSGSTGNEGCSSCGCRVPDLMLDIRVCLTRAMKAVHPSAANPLESAKRRREHDTADEVSEGSVERRCNLQCLPGTRPSHAIPLPQPDKPSSLPLMQQPQQLSASWPLRTYATLHIQPLSFCPAAGTAAASNGGASGVHCAHRRMPSSGNVSSSSSGAWGAVAHVAYDIQPADYSCAFGHSSVVGAGESDLALEVPATARSHAVQSNPPAGFAKSGNCMFGGGGGSDSFDPMTSGSCGPTSFVDPASVVHGMPVSVAVAAATCAYHATVSAALDSSVGTRSWGAGGAVVHHQWPAHPFSKPLIPLVLQQASMAATLPASHKLEVQAQSHQSQQEGMQSSDQPTTSAGGLSVQQQQNVQQQEGGCGSEQCNGVELEEQGASPRAQCQQVLPLSQAWHDSAADEAARLKVAKAVIQVLESSGLGRALLGQRMLPAVRRIELLLYRAAACREEYLDPTTMLARIMQLVQLQRTKLHAQRHGGRSVATGAATIAAPPPAAKAALLHPAASSACVSSLAASPAAATAMLAPAQAAVAAPAAVSNAVGAPPAAMAVSAFAAAAMQPLDELVEVMA